MKKALVFVLALILLVGVFAACGDKEKTTTAATTTTAAPTGPATTAPATTAPNGDGTTTTEPGTTQPVVTQPDLDMTADDKDPTMGEDYTGAGEQLPWMPF